MDQSKIGKFIAQTRREQGLTQRALAEALGISDKTISKWETGKGLPEVGLMLPLCKQLGITVNELLTGERLTQEHYVQKAEETIMQLLNEKEINKRRRLGAWMMLLVDLVLAFGIVFVAVSYDIPRSAASLLVILATAVALWGEVMVCILDRTTGYFQCRHCGELFVPDWKTYLKGSWSILPGSGYLTCPHCGKAGMCKRKMEK